MMVAGGTIWLVYHGLVLAALSYTTMGVFTNLSPTELHPNVPLATPIPSDFFDETTQYMMGRRSGWCGELLTMAVAMLGAAWQFCDSPQASNALAKWWGRAFLAQLCAFWVVPLYEATIFKACWVWFFWAAFGGAWLWSEFGLEKPKRRPRPGSWSRSKKRGDAPVEEPAATAPAAAAKPAKAKAPTPKASEAKKAPLPKSPKGAPPPPPPPGGAGKFAPPNLGTRCEGFVVEATSGPRTNYAFVRPRGRPSSGAHYNLFLHANDMRAGEAWVAVGDRVAYTVAKNEGKTGPHRIAIKAVKCADVVVLERAGGPPPGATGTTAPPKLGTRAEGTVVEATSGPRTNYAFVRPADASSDDLYLHAAQMREGEAWVAIGDRVAYTVAKNEGKPGMPIKAVKCADAVVLERAGGGADAPPPPPPPPVASAFKSLPPGANPAPPKPGTRGEGTVVEVRGRGEGTQYGFVRPADASSDDLFLHAADMRAGEAWGAIGDRVAYVIAKNAERYVIAKNAEKRTGGGKKAVRKTVKCAEVVVLDRARGAADAAARIAACSYGESARALKRRDAAVGRAAKSPPRPPGLAAKPPPGFQLRVGWEDDDSDDSLERYA